MFRRDCEQREEGPMVNKNDRHEGTYDHTVAREERIGAKNLDIEIVRLASDGSGVGYTDGITTFVPRMLPGEKGKIQLTEQKKSYRRAQIVEIEQMSEERVEPPCTVYPVCGGCNLQHVEYQTTLAWKQRWVEDALRRIGGFTDIRVEPVLGMDDPWRYRNKAVLHRDLKGRFGYYREKSKDVTVFDDCLLLRQETNHRIKKMQQVIGECCEGIKTATFRESNRGKGLLVFDGNTENTKELDQLISKLKEQAEFSPQSCSITIPRGNNVFEGSGAQYLNEHLNDLRFKVSPRSFLQVNPAQTAVLYGLVLDWAGLTGEDEVWDLYCGIGTMTLMLAQRAKRVLGIEENPYAIADAQENAEDNNIINVRFVEGKVEEKLAALSETPDLIVCDPPRAGMEPEVLEGLLDIGPERIIYVSCNPATLARDLKVLCRNTYRIKRVQPVDMFPWTQHVECIILMTNCGQKEK